MKALELVDELMSDNEHLAASYSEIATELRRLAAVEAERDALKAENALLAEVNAQLREQNDAVGEACAKYEAELERIKTGKQK